VICETAPAVRQGNNQKRVWRLGLCTSKH
jgi:hypothetical protein